MDQEKLHNIDNCESKINNITFKNYIPSWCFLLAENDYFLDVFVITLAFCLRNQIYFRLAQMLAKKSKLRYKNPFKTAGVIGLFFCSLKTMNKEIKPVRSSKIALQNSIKMYPPTHTRLLT